MFFFSKFIFELKKKIFFRRGLESLFFNYRATKAFFGGLFGVFQSLVLKTRVRPGAYFLSNLAFSKIIYNNENGVITKETPNVMDFAHRDINVPLENFASGVDEGDYGRASFQLADTFNIAGFNRGVTNNFYKINSFILLKFIMTLFTIAKRKKGFLKYTNYVGLFIKFARNRAAQELKTVRAYYKKSVSDLMEYQAMYGAIPTLTDAEEKKVKKDVELYKRFGEKVPNYLEELLANNLVPRTSSALLGVSTRRMYNRVYYALLKFIKNYVIPRFSLEERRYLKERPVLLGKERLIKKISKSRGYFYNVVKKKVSRFKSKKKH
jgi:hypothetical protein